MIAASHTARRFYALAFLAGWALMAGEILVGRLLSAYFGSSIVQWGALIGVILTAMALGYLYGGRVGNQDHAAERVGHILLICGIYNAISIALFPVLIPVSVAAGAFVGVLGAVTVLMALPAFGLAAVSPILLRLLPHDEMHLTQSAGRLSASYTIGNILGTFCTAFFIIPYLGSDIAFYSILVVYGLIFYLLKPLVGKKSLLACAVLIGAIFLHLATHKTPEHVIYQTESAYSKIQVVERPPLTYMKLNQFSIESLLTPGQLLQGYYIDYPLMMASLHPNGQGLLLGVGGGTFLHQIYEAFPNMQFDAVDIDAKVIDVAKTYFQVGQLPNVAFHAQDARWFVNHHGQNYDLVAFDLFRDGVTPDHLLTQEFFAEIKAHLNPGGHIIMNVLTRNLPSPLQEPFFRSLVASLSPSFQHIYTVSLNNVTPHIATQIVIATDESEQSLKNSLQQAQKPLVLQLFTKLNLQNIQPTPVPDGALPFTDNRNTASILSFPVQRAFVQQLAQQ